MLVNLTIQASIDGEVRKGINSNFCKDDDDVPNDLEDQGCFAYHQPAINDGVDLFRSLIVNLNVRGFLKKYKCSFYFWDI
jgi:hypothetical protein